MTDTVLFLVGFFCGMLAGAALVFEKYNRMDRAPRLHVPAGKYLIVLARDIRVEEE